MLETKQKGLIVELECMTYLYKLGYQVSTPYGENSRYDLIADIEGKLIRIQCKSCVLSKDKSYISFRCVSMKKKAQKERKKKYTSDEIDYFATYYKNQCYLVPVNECSIEKKLRFYSPENGQKKGISFAEQYTAEMQIKKILSEK